MISAIAFGGMAMVAGNGSGWQIDDSVVIADDGRAIAHPRDGVLVIDPINEEG